MHSDDVFRGRIMMALVTCSPEVFRDLWASCADPLKCPLGRHSRPGLEPGCQEGTPDTEVIELILDRGRRW